MAISDVSDPFALDAVERHGDAPARVVPAGRTTDRTPGGILNLGFTGLMTNGVSNYATLFDPNKMTAGGAAGVVTVDEVSEGDAFGSLNNQEYALQFGLWANPADTGPFFVHTRILAPFAGLTPQDGQSMGMFVGTGDQDNYAKIVLYGERGRQRDVRPRDRRCGGAGTVGTTGDAGSHLRRSLLCGWILRRRPFSRSIRSPPAASPARRSRLRLPRQYPQAGSRTSASGMALGIISTSRGPGAPFPGTWDFIQALPATQAPTLGAGADARSRLATLPSGRTRA